MPFELNEKITGLLYVTYYLDTNFSAEMSEPKESTDVSYLCLVNIRSSRKESWVFQIA